MIPRSDPATIRAWRERSKGLKPRPVPRTRGEVIPLRSAPRYTGPDKLTRETVLERDRYQCVCCGVSVIGQPYSLQHRKRRSQGGDNSPPNLITVLGTGTTGCHLRIDSRIDPHDEEKGYTVRSWQNPSDVPVMVFSEGGSGMTLWATEDGQWTRIPPWEREGPGGAA